MNLDDPQDRSAAAGEYVLGTLAPDERLAVERAMAEDGELRAEVYAWQDRLLGLTAGIQAAEPAPDLWQRIEAALGVPAGQTAPVRQPAAGAAAAPAANDPSWRRLRFWQTISGLAIAASILLASVLLLRGPGSSPESARYLAILQGPDRSAGWVVEITQGDRLRLVPVATSAPPPPGKALQFWTKPEGAAGPTSLGLVRPGEVTELPVSRLPALGERQLFELTLEGEAGSPIGRPTGPILFVGTSVRL